MIRGGTHLVAAAFASLVAHLWLPLTDEDPLRSTLVLLPLVLAALFHIGRWARNHGGSPTTRRIIAAELALLAALVLLSLSRHQLGLSHSGSSLDGAVVAGFALLLAHRVARLLLTLRPSLGTVLPSRPPWPFLVLPFVVYLAILPWSAGNHAPDGDEPHYLLLTHSLAYDFDSDLANNYEHGDSLAFVNRRLEPQLGDPVGRNGELYSRHNILLPLVLAPFYRLFGVAGALALMAFITATVAWLTLALASEYVPNRPVEALVAYSILAFSAPLLLYSYQIWVEVPAALLTLVVLLQVYRIGQRSDGSGVSAASGWLSLSISLLLLPLLKIRFLVIAVPLVLLMSLRSDRIVRKRILVLIAGLAVIGPGILLFNQSVFQNPLKYHDIDGLRPYVLPAINYMQGLTGLAFDCGFGLVSYGPLWLLLLPAGTLLIASRSRLITDFAIVFVPYLALLAPRGEWFGAWSPPFRYGIVMLPMLALWLVPLLKRGTRVGARALLTCLAVLTVALTLLWIVEPGWTYNLAHGRSHLLDLLAERMDVDVARFFASSTRVRAATWVWPPVAFVLTTLAWWIPRQRLSRSLVLGLTGALLAPAAVLWAAHNKPTRVIEFEDPWIGHQSGAVWPEIWVIYRPRFRGGWLLLPTDTISVPLIARGNSFELELSFRNRWDLPVSGILELTDGTGTLLAREELPGVDNWETVELTNLPTPVDDNLTLTLLAPDGTLETHLILDRAQINWSR